MRLGLALVVAVALASAGCSDGDDGGKPRLTVAAATSLKTAFEDYDGRFDAATARFSFAGSDALAAQIRRGVHPDVYAAANTELPRRLFAEGLVERPVVFARNRLVVAVRRGRGDLDSLEDLAAPGLDLALGAESVPVGTYTRALLAGLAPRTRRGILANVRSREPDVAGIVAKVARGAADAGFVYATDLARQQLEAIDLPPDLTPEIEYGVAVLDGPRRREAQEFVDGLLRGEGRRALDRAGFE